jgi:hypothetical protein
LAKGWPGGEHKARDVRLADILRNVSEHEMREKLIDATVRSDSAPRMPESVTASR